MAITITFRSATRQDDDGNDVVQGTIKQTAKGLTATGSGVSVLQTARNRLWDDDRIVQYYTNWSNGYAYSSAQ